MSEAGVTMHQSPTEGILRAEAAILGQQYRDAKEQLQAALRAAPTSPRSLMLMDLVESKLKTASSKESDTAVIGLLFEETDEWPNVERVQPPAMSPFALPRNMTNDRSDKSIEETQEQTKRAGNSTIENVEDENSKETGLVSETLAKILIAQGKSSEATKVFIQLARLNPGRYEYYRQQIDNLSPIDPETTMEAK